MFLRDLFGWWHLDHAGELEGPYRPHELYDMVQTREVNPHQWARHAFTRRFRLVGEVLLESGLITEDEFDEMIPKPHLLVS